MNGVSILPGGPARIGKGGGFSDLKVAFLVEAGVLGPDTALATTVHPRQVVNEPLPETIRDFPVDLIVTPDEAIWSAEPHRPPGTLMAPEGQPSGQAEAPAPSRHTPIGQVNGLCRIDDPTVS
jgi:hypothetical protein